MKVNIAQKINYNEDIIGQILRERGLTMDWLEANEDDFYSGTEFKNFAKARKLLLSNMEDGYKIGIIMDNDMDGVASATIMHQWLLDRNSKLEIVPIITEGKIHGLLPHLIPDDLNLLIIPDASSNEKNKHKEIADKGIPILILDHHEMEEESEYAVIINPHNPLCTYPNKSLSGGGVVYKFIEAMDTLENLDYYTKYTDLAAISIVADVMSLKELENKAIVNLGLKEIKNKYLQAYLKADQRVKDKEINANLVAFYLAPQINSLIRMGTIEEKQELYQAIVGDTPPEPVVANLIKLKGKQDRKKESVLPRIVMNLQQEGLDNYNVIMTTAPKNLPSPMTGLVCGQLAGLYNKPVFLGREHDGYLTGSARSVNNSNIENLKDFCEESGLFEWNMGHQAAHGFKIKIENVSKFIEYCEENLPPFEKQYYADFKLSGDKKEVVETVYGLNSHAGCDFPEILIYDEIYISPTDFNIIGKNQNTMVIKTDDLEYIQFRFKKDIPQESGILRIIGKPNLNEFMGNITPQIIIEDWEWVPLIL